MTIAHLLNSGFLALRLPQRVGHACDRYKPSHQPTAQAIYRLCPNGKCIRQYASILRRNAGSCDTHGIYRSGHWRYNTIIRGVGRKDTAAALERGYSFVIRRFSFDKVAVHEVESIDSQTVDMLGDGGLSPWLTGLYTEQSIQQYYVKTERGLDALKRPK